MGFHSSQVTLAEFPVPFIPCVAPFPDFLTFFLELQIQLPVKMHSFIAHVVVVSTQIAPAAIPIGCPAVNAAEYMMHMQIDRCTAHITSAVIAD
jgi:hypothetical protein